MSLPKFCIHRPAFTIVISLVLVIVGLLSYLNLPIRWIPNITLPNITIQTTYPGANASLVEQDVTKVIESTLSGIDGIRDINSSSKANSSNIHITFKLGTNMNTALEEVRTNLEQIRGQLPQDINNPIVSKADIDNDPLLIIALFDESKSQQALSDYVDKFIIPAFETLDGVAGVWTYGKQSTVMKISLDPIKMAAAHVTANEVANKIHSENLSAPSGYIKGKDQYIHVMIDMSLNKPSDFNNLIIRESNGQVIRLKDIGKAKLAPFTSDSAFRINGKNGLAIAITPLSMANPIQVEHNVQNLLTKLKPSLPKDMQVNVIFNKVNYINASINSVYHSLFEAIIFVWLVMLIFLCSFRATLIPLVTIPICLISTFSILYLFGFTINTITLMAFVLAIGLVVDDAIIMQENINRHIESGLSPFAAGIKGSQEMIFPIIAMTITLAAVYIPIAFTDGLLGSLFREFTVTLAGAVLISGVIALTLSPMMCTYILKSKQKENRFAVWFNRQLENQKIVYQLLLHYLLNHRIKVLLSFISISLLGIWLYHLTPAELTPDEDTGYVYTSIGVPKSSSFAYLDNEVKKIEAIYKNIPDIQSFLTISGMRSTSHAFQILSLSPKRHEVLDNLIDQINQKAMEQSTARIHVFKAPSALAEVAGSNDGGGSRIGLALMTASDYLKLERESTNLMNEIRKIKGITFVDNKLKWDTEQFKLVINREKAATLKINISNIINTISTLIAGRTIGKTNDADVMIKVDEALLDDPNLFQLIYIKNDAEQLLPLTSVASVKTSTQPDVFHHVNRLRGDIIYISLLPNFSLAEAVKKITQVAKENLSEDIQFSFKGEAKSFLESNGKMTITFILALIFIYLVLVAQFESFIDPLIILFTVPFALIGALLSLKLFGGSLNIYSNIGMITLIGLIAKHGILITEFANKQQELGYSLNDAIIRACLLRLRPILMTTLAMILGAIPLAIASGPGFESRQQIGLVMVGGLFLGSIFSLIIIPIIYTFLSPLKLYFRRDHVLTIEENVNHFH